MEKINIKIEEGKSYPFTIMGTVVLPDDKVYFKVQDPNNINHLLYKQYYSNYDNLKKGEIVNCRIDRINCTGKIYLEPQHPYYERNKVFPFTLLRYDEYINSENEYEQIAIFKDVFDNEIEVPYEDLPRIIKPGDKLDCEVVKIKKGRVYISATNSSNEFDGMVAGKEYDFKVSHLKTYGGRYDYFILIGQDGRRFKLRRKFYSKYGLKAGQKIKCRLIVDDDQKYLEPNHPYYSIGSIYDFKIVGEGSVTDYPDIKKKVYLLRNSFGKEIQLEKSRVAPESIKNREIKCKVVDIRRSKPYIECIF